MTERLWKLDSALRGKLDSSEPIAVAVQPIGTAGPLDLAPLVAIGLRPPVTRGGLWEGTIRPGQLTEILALDVVGYVHDATSQPASGERVNRVYTPPKPSKRGHTKLPPRRD